ncbi:PFL_4669 family integrating conjugative element protein [Pasteurella oralis]|uniref:PFL_4669 family integrating conjugative element protein n=1 Tax=Pasteurella oralis TaxID=1071947 RepID=UPI000C79619B|nr:TIGR03761 family integrating conjugative element protein [Pasteurella oralis]
MTTLQNQHLGALRSNITLTLHSQYATKLWQGRPMIREGKKVIKPQILSMTSCLAILSQIQKDAANDDPYADFFLIQFEDMVLKNTEEMKVLVNKLLDIYSDDIPDNINIQSCTNIEPVQYPIYADSPLAYKLIYLLCEFDTLAKSAMTAAYIALMTKAESRQWLEAGAVLLRRCFGVIENYRHTGITRQDVKVNSTLYKDAVKRFKIELPEDVISAQKRAKFAPEIRSRITTDTEILDDLDESN